VDPVPAELSDPTPTGPYQWQNVVIKGGGFVSGIVFSRAVPNLIYARTDVGGAYRYNQTSGRWVPLLDWVGQPEAGLLGIESIAADPVDPSRVYLAAGTYLTAGNGSILKSTNFGKTWTRVSIAVPMGGNADGRSMGERLAIDPNQTNILYFGTRNNGLWSSQDAGATWRQVTSFPATGDLNLGLSFVVFDEQTGTPGAPTPVLYVGVATLTGETLFRTTNAGSSWEAVAGHPTGMMPHHGDISPDGILYLAYNNLPGPNGITLGAVHKYDLVSAEWSQATPVPHGIGGISVDRGVSGTVMASTLDWWAPDEIYRTNNGGTSWSRVGNQAIRDINGAQWLFFQQATLSASGWMGDFEIDPFNSSRALYVTGQGIWWTDDLTAADSGQATHWSFRDDGLEETVALDLVSPPSGAELLSAVGDLGGFRHDDLDQSPPTGMYNPRFGNTNSLDFAESQPNIVVRVGTAATGGIPGAYSIDGGTSWTQFATQPTSSTGQGSVAISADGATLVWSARGATPSYSQDRGQTWTACTGLSGNVRLASDRVNPNKFYAAATSGVFVSTDGGMSFSSVGLASVPRGARIRPVFGIEGDVWLVSTQGLQHSTDSAAAFTPVPNVSSALALGFGRAAPDQAYPALYLSGTVSGVPGIYRSDDGGQSFMRIDDSQHQFGWVSVVTGDPRRYGRVYLGTGGRGILYGDPL
jgi:hypothetical protein